MPDKEALAFTHENLPDLLNRMDKSVQFKRGTVRVPPKVREVAEGEFINYYDGTHRRIYTKMNGELCFVSFSTEGMLMGPQGPAGPAGPAGAQGPAGMGLATWTTATRPNPPSIGLSQGYNTDLNGNEVYTTYGWLVVCGIWTFATRPNTTGLAAGSRGYNLQLTGFEYWNGAEWVPG